MTTIVLAHPNQHCPRFQVFGVCDGDDDRFTFYELKSARISGVPKRGTGSNSPELANLGTADSPVLAGRRAGATGKISTNGEFWKGKFARFGGFGENVSAYGERRRHPQQNLSPNAPASEVQPKDRTDCLRWLWIVSG